MTIVIRGPLSEDDEEYYEQLAAMYCEECFEELLIKQMAKPLED